MTAPQSKLPAVLPAPPAPAPPEPSAAESALIAVMKTPSPPKLPAALAKLPATVLAMLDALPAPALALIIDMQAYIDRADAEIARYKEPFAEDYQLLKPAEFYSGVPRQTLMNWVRDGKVKHVYVDNDGKHYKRPGKGRKLKVEVIDARRQKRFSLPF